MKRLCALVLLAAGCGSARYIKQTPTGGTLLLEGDPDKARRQAERMMTIHCAGRYTIVKDGERVGGTEAERLQTTQMRFVCVPTPPKPPPPAAVQTDAGAPPPAAN